MVERLGFWLRDPALNWVLEGELGSGPIQLLVGLAEQAKQVNGLTLIRKVENSNSHLKSNFQASEAMPSIKTHTQDEVMK
jgi:hypothetical protein